MIELQEMVARFVESKQTKKENWSVRFVEEYSAGMEWAQTARAVETPTTKI